MRILILSCNTGEGHNSAARAIKEELDVPVKYIGVGEQIDDLQPFDPDEFAKALFADDYDDDGVLIAEEAVSEESASENTAEENTETPEEPLSEEDEWLRSWRNGEQDEKEPEPVKEEKEEKTKVKRTERKAKKQFNWSTAPATETEEDDEWLKNWRDGSNSSED